MFCLQPGSKFDKKQCRRSISNDICQVLFTCLHIWIFFCVTFFHKIECLHFVCHWIHKGNVGAAFVISYHHYKIDVILEGIPKFVPGVGLVKKLGKFLEITKVMIKLDKKSREVIFWNKMVFSIWRYNSFCEKAHYTIIYIFLCYFYRRWLDRQEREGLKSSSYHFIVTTKWWNSWKDYVNFEVYVTVGINFAFYKARADLVV